MSIAFSASRAAEPIFINPETGRECLYQVSVGILGSLLFTLQFGNHLPGFQPKITDRLDIPLAAELYPAPEVLGVRLVPLREHSRERVRLSVALKPPQGPNHPLTPSEIALFKEKIKSIWLGLAVHSTLDSARLEYMEKVLWPNFCHAYHGRADAATLWKSFLADVIRWLKLGVSAPNQHSLRLDPQFAEFLNQPGKCKRANKVDVLLLICWDSRGYAQMHSNQITADIEQTAGILISPEALRGRIKRLGLKRSLPKGRPVTHKGNEEFNR